MGIDTKQVHKPIRKLRKLLKNLPKVASPDQVHALRTNSRRLEALISSLALDSGREARRLLKHVGRVRKSAGTVRDMDVLTGFIASLEVDAEEHCKLQLIEHLESERQKYAKRLHDVVARKRQRARPLLKRISRQLELALCERDEDDCDPALVNARAAGSALALESSLATPLRLSRNNLHSYRLKVKELQNVLRLGEGSDNQEFLKTLGHLKDSIGEWHDWEELLGIAKEVLDHGGKCQLIRKLKAVCASNYEDALAEGQMMRSKYLGFSARKPRPALAGAAKPVWNAAAAIAA